VLMILVSQASAGSQAGRQTLEPSYNLRPGTGMSRACPC
jgi:hypothetical protein